MTVNSSALFISIAGGTDEDEDGDVGEALPVMKKSRLESDFEELFGPHYESGKKDSRATPAEEIRDYFATPHIPTMDNPLKWWSRNKEQFPRLAKLAHRYLAVPATSTPSERVFSLAGNTITRQRSSLHPEHVDTLIFLHENQESKAVSVKEEEDSNNEEE